ncbi:MAG: sensor histidine kinase, partial [Gemmatimonadaceae bacterium]
LRTPINAMLGYTQLLDMGLAGPVTEAQRDYLVRLAASSEHLLSLVNDVLDLARVDAGRMPVAREAAWTARVVETGLALALPLAEAKGVRIVDATGGDPGVQYVGDEGRARQILVNLLSNAVKFTPSRGTVTVSSGLTAEMPAGARLGGGGPWTFLRVADTGVGIALEDQAAIFEPFTQVEQNDERGGGPYRRTQGGTGLGLTVSRRLARLMGGDLTVESEVGHGATFTLWLPSPAQAGDPADVTAERALRGADGYRVRGLAEIGEHLRERADIVIESFAARLRRESSIPAAAGLRRSDVEDHQLAFLADLAQSLVVIEESGGLAPDLLRDGSTIQRVIAELHGRTRQRQGWTDEQLAREYAILGEEIEALVRRHVPDGTGDASTALEVLQRLVGRAAATARRALRLAAAHRDPP